MKIKENDQVEVTGSRIYFDGENLFTASEVKKGDEVIILRDEDGLPKWSGWKRGN